MKLSATLLLLPAVMAKTYFKETFDNQDKWTTSVFPGKCRFQTLESPANRDIEGDLGLHNKASLPRTLDTATDCIFLRCVLPSTPPRHCVYFATFTLALGTECRSSQISPQKPPPGAPPRRGRNHTCLAGALRSGTPFTTYQSNVGSPAQTHTSF